MNTQSKFHYSLPLLPRLFGSFLLLVLLLTPMTTRAWTFVNTGNCTTTLAYKIGYWANYCCGGLLYNPVPSESWLPEDPWTWLTLTLEPGQTCELSGWSTGCIPDPCTGVFDNNCACAIDVDLTLNLNPQKQTFSALRFGSDATFYLDCQRNLTLLKTQDPDLPPRTDCNGMAVWAVSEPRINLWIEDEPLGYQPSHGPRVSCQLNYNQREGKAGYNPRWFSAGKNWNLSWLSYVDLVLTRPILYNSYFSPAPSESYNYAAGDQVVYAVVHLPGGGTRPVTGISKSSDSSTTFTWDSLTGLTLSLDNSTGVYTASYSDGSKDVYGFLVASNSTFIGAFLTERWDAAGRRLLLEYYDYCADNPVNLTDPSGNDGSIIEFGIASSMSMSMRATWEGSRVNIYGGTIAAALAVATYYGGSWALSEHAQIAAARSALAAAGTSIANEIAKARQIWRTRVGNPQIPKIVPMPTCVIPAVAANVAVGQLTFPGPLTRASLFTTLKNRYNVTRGRGSAGPGMSWDEYPFASTDQGGTRASVVRPVPEKENWIQGGIIAAAYVAEKIRVGDSFVVIVTP